MSRKVRASHVLQSTGAVLGGMLVLVILSIGTDMILRAVKVYPNFGEPMSDAQYVFATFYRIVYAVASGYLVARLAPDRPMRLALIFGAVGLVAGIAGAVAARSEGPEFGPKWYPIAIVVIAMPCAWVGGKLFGMVLRARADG